MGIRSAPVFRSHFPCLGPRYPYSHAPTAHRQEGSHDYHPLRAARPDHDEILQVLDRQFVGVLLRWNGSPAIVFGLDQELYQRERTQYRIEQFPQRGSFLRRLV